MVFQWNQEQGELLKALSLPFPLFEDIPDESLADLEQAVADHLQLHGLDDDGVNDVGRICESILDEL